jgi:MFS family permease
MIYVLFLLFALWQNHVFPMYVHMMLIVAFFCFLVFLLDFVFPKTNWVHWYHNKWDERNHYTLQNFSFRVPLIRNLTLTLYLIPMTLYLKPDEDYVSRYAAFLFMFAGLVTSQFLFDLSHSAMHVSNAVNKGCVKIHHYHHRIKQPRSTDAFDSHVLEFLILYLTTVFLPVALLPISRYQAMWFVLMVIYASLTTHVSYDFHNKHLNSAFVLSSKHYRHHQNYNL